MEVHLGEFTRSERRVRILVAESSDAFLQTDDKREGKNKWK